MAYFFGAVVSLIALHLLFEIRNSLQQARQRLDGLDALLANLQIDVADAALEASNAKDASERLLKQMEVPGYN